MNIRKNIYTLTFGSSSSFDSKLHFDALTVTMRGNPEGMKKLHPLFKFAPPLVPISITLLCLISWCRAANVGLEELYRLDQLPQYKTAIKVASVSSYDRTGGNDDGFSGTYSFVRKEGTNLILADLKGPGVIYRVWTPTPTEDVLEFLFDGETQPRVEVKMLDLFLGKYPAFPRPLVGTGVGGYFCYVPLPFAKSCIVRLRAPKMQFYQINYAIYGPDTPVTTFSTQPSDEYLKLRDQTCALFSRAGSDISAFTAAPKTKVESKQSTITLKSHSTQKVFEATRGGRIVGLQFSPASALIGKARDLMLKITFDGETTVMCPLGDFFGYAWGQPAVQSLLVGTTGETNYCYFPMPFDRAAKVELISERTTPLDLRATVLHSSTPRTTNEARFHALWRRENPTQVGKPFTFIETKGRGHLVGVVLQSQGFESGKTLFFEGDDQTTIDGELTINGTGSEDFFNGGWYDVPDRWEKHMSFPLSGCLGYAKHLGRTGAYRMFIGDAYSYRQSLLQTIEHAGEGNTIPTDYCSVSYLYSERALTTSLTPPPLPERAVIDPEEVAFPAWWQTPIYAWSFGNANLTRKSVRIGQEDIRYLSLTGTGTDWFGPHFLSPTCDVPTSGKYSIYIEAVKGPGQAKVQLFQNENPVADPVDLFADKQIKSERLLLGQLDLTEGKNNLMFKLVGRNDQSSGLGLDLVTIICVRNK